MLFLSDLAALQRLRPLCGFVMLGVSVGLTSCSSSSSGSSGGFDRSGQVLSVTFPDPADQNVENEDQPPSNAALVQQIVIRFSGRPNPSDVSAFTLPVRGVADGAQVNGTYEVDGQVVTFTPALPTEPSVQQPNGVFSSGGAGLEPAGSYFLTVGNSTWSFVSGIETNLANSFGDPTDPDGIVMVFTTTSQPQFYFTGITARRPRLVDSTPDDGDTNVTPSMFSDPMGLFPPRQGFSVSFDAAVRTDLANVSDQTFKLVDLDENLELGTEVRFLSNTLNSAEIQVIPNGILPFGHLVCLEYPAALRGLSETAAPSATAAIAATFTVADVPSGVATVEDLLEENFESVERQEQDFTELELGEIPADWDVNDSNILQAALAVEVGGVLGRFAPAAPAPGDTRTVILDTNTMNFPMLDGSTPDAPPNTTVIGGSFAFTDIDIPNGILVQPIGTNPLVLLATGSVRIAGEINASGADGTPENSYDSAVSSIPGGNGVAGGGRGGEAHPVMFSPPTQQLIQNLVSPPFAGHGWGPGNLARTGGLGGECGMYDNADGNGNFGTDSEIDCGELVDQHNNSFNGYPEGYKPPGGGGGSHLTAGGKGKNGLGNILADGRGNYFVDPDGNNKLESGIPGPLAFQDADPSNDFIGVNGELQTVSAGQGGGGGGSALDGYYCGDWCRNDLDPTNDGLCQVEAAIVGFASSVGDSRGGSAGAGGGAIVIRALGEVTVTATGRVTTRGGQGGGGEAIGCGNWAGGGGSGSGGAILVQSGTDITVEAGGTLNVRGGGWTLVTRRKNYVFPCNIVRGGAADGEVRGDGGNGGDGIIQLQVPAGQQANVDPATAKINPIESWVDPTNTLNPSEFTPLSVALSDWFDMGRTIDRPPTGTNPIFEFLLSGVPAEQLPQNQDPNDPLYALVPTDVSGHVLDPQNTDIICDYLGQLDPVTGQFRAGEQPQQNFIPKSASVKVEFQGASAFAPGSKEVDPATVTEWSASPAVANGKQFLRYRITFNIAADGSPLSQDSRLPAVQRISVRARF